MLGLAAAVSQDDTMQRVLKAPRLCESTGHFNVYRLLLLGLVQVELSGDLRQKQETVVFGNRI